jgi:hypothetical protein
MLPDSGTVAKKRKRAPRQKAPTVDYRDGEGNVLVLRESLSGPTMAKLREADAGAGATVDDAWRRRQEMLFERLTVRWDIGGLPLTDQAMLVGRLRMADPDTQRWVRETIRSHVERHMPELAEG